MTHTKAISFVSIILALSVSAGAVVYYENDFESGYSTDTAFTGSGSRSFHYAAVGPCSDGQSEFRFNLWSNAHPDAYARWYQYFPNGTEDFCPGGKCNKWVHRRPSGCSSNASNNKWLRIWAGPYGGGNSPYMGLSFWADGNGGSNASCTFKKNCSGINYHETGLWHLTDADKGRWICVEANFRANTSVSSPNGGIRLWIDGDLEYDSGNQALPADPACSDNYFDTMYLMGWSNAGFDEESYCYIDTLQVASVYNGPLGYDPPPDPDPDPEPDPDPDPEPEPETIAEVPEVDQNVVESELEEKTVTAPGAVTVLPNVVSNRDTVSVRFTVPTSADTSEVVVRIIDITGKVVGEGEVEYSAASNGTLGSADIDVAELGVGVYFAVASGITGYRSAGTFTVLR